MSEKKADSGIRELFEEIEIYKQAIQDAKDALASAEQELDAKLDAAGLQEGTVSR